MAAAHAAQTNPTPGSVRDVIAPTKRTVTYKLNSSATSKSLSVPCALAVNGTVVQGLTKPARLKHNGSISVKVDEGSKVSLYLNSDAHPSYRTQPVYEVTACEHDILVQITEKKGKSTDVDTPVFSKTSGADDKRVDNYAAPLTGNIWMKISRKYSRSDADGLIPADADAGVRSALLSVYDELTSATLKIACIVPDNHVITVTFNDSDNPKQNIDGYELKRDGLTRVHPAGLYALFEAARKAACTAMTVTSCWRPSLGSIAHRAGLGLDVNYLEDANAKIRINRQELRGKGPDVDWVAEEEKRLLGEYETAKQKVAGASETLKKAEAALKASKNKPAEVAGATKARDEARVAKTAADKALADADAAWNSERDANEPAGLLEFRRTLESNSSISQVFDPWYMDSNTRDNVAHTPNRQVTGNETLHAHHLHVTVKDINIL